jgi:uncharacterized protein YutE (UPF0331/DUF86 family)
MGELPRQILAEKESVEIALKNLKIAMDREEKSVVELAAIGTFLHNIYNGIENILKQVLLERSIDVPQSDSWHKDLLNLSASMGIISEKLSDELYAYLTFRHFFVHAYGFMLDEDQLEDLAVNIPDVWAEFLTAIKMYLGA